MPKWVYPLAFLFVLFIIFNDPSGSGDMAGRFGGFIVDLLGAVGEFLTGLLEGASDANTTESGSSERILGGTGANTATLPDTTAVDSFNEGTPHTHTHSHDG